jgi:hypothetical protein
MTLLHAILTLHEQIRTGEITRRREETGAGAGVHVGSPEGRVQVHVGTPR